MGHKFGNLANIRRIVYFKLSPHELKAVPSVMDSAANLLERAAKQVAPILIPTVFTYWIIKFANEANAAANRKNPKDYENDT